MLKKISLRARLTLLSAMVMASVAVMLTGMFLVGADRIFVRSLQQYFVTQSDEYDIVLSTAILAETDPGEMTFTIKQAGNRFNLWGVAGLVLMLFLGTGATWLMAGKALKPLGELTDTIEEIGGNNLSRRVEHQDRADEIGQLAGSFNHMMDNVSASFERQQRFSASAAHELKPPPPCNHAGEPGCAGHGGKGFGSPDGTGAVNCQDQHGADDPSGGQSVPADNREEQ